jgi:hypothetical protein
MDRLVVLHAAVVVRVLEQGAVGRRGTDFGYK